MAITSKAFENEVFARLGRMERLLNLLLDRSAFEIGMEIQNMINLDDLIREVEETKGAAASSKVLIKGLYQKIRELKVPDPAVQAKLNELAASLQSAQDELASAVETDPDSGGETGATGGTGDTGATGPA